MTDSMRRDLGRDTDDVSAMGLGCWAIGGPAWRGQTPVGWGEVDDNETIRAIHTAIDMGVDFFDTADVYGAGHSERILGRAIRDHRGRVRIATKFGNLFDESSRQVSGSDASPAYIKYACEASLQRLRTDYIDLYQFHLGGYDLDRAEDVRDTLEALVADGKIRAYGWSTDSVERAYVFSEGTNCTAVQHQMNVLRDAPEMVELCEKLGLAGINRGPLAMGLLTGKYDRYTNLPDEDVRGRNAPAWMRYFSRGRADDTYLSKLRAVREILTSEGRTLAQGALAWLWGRTSRSIPIPGFKTVEQVQENAAAMELGPLKPSQMEEIDRLLVRKD